MTESAEPSGRLAKIGASLAARVRRLRPDRVRGGYRAVLIAVWVLIAIVAMVLLFMDPDAVGTEAATLEDPVDRFFAPLWLRMLLMVAIALLAVGACVLAALRADLDGRWTRRGEIRFEVVLAVSAGFPAFALAAEQQFVLACVAAIAFAGVETVAHLHAVTRRGSASIPMVAGAVLVPWLVLIAAQPSGAVASEGWTWASLFWFAATFAVFGAYYGIVRASEVRTRRLTFTRRRDLRPAVAWTCIVVVAALVVMKLTVARGVFSEGDAQLWAPWQKAPMSWALALLVAFLITVGAVRSSRKPLRRRGDRLVAGVIAATGVIELALSWLAIVVGMVVAIVSGALYLPDGFVEWYQFVQLALLIAVALLVCLPVFHRTAARSVAWASTLYLIPVLVLMVSIASAPRWFSVATSVQVSLLLLVVAVGLALWNVIRPNTQVGWRVIARLAIVPFIVVHAGLLLPAILTWSARYVLIAGALVSLLFFLPKVAADPRRRALDLIGASSAVLLGLVVAVLALPSIFKDEVYTLFGTLWLSVTVITGLVLELEPRGGQPEPDTAEDPLAREASAS
jgi:hypothetical protein